jgi:hypothetical protein
MITELKEDLAKAAADRRRGILNFSEEWEQLTWKDHEEVVSSDEDEIVAQPIKKKRGRPLKNSRPSREPVQQFDASMDSVMEMLPSDPDLARGSVLETSPDDADAAVGGVAREVEFRDYVSQLERENDRLENQISALKGEVQLKDDRIRQLTQTQRGASTTDERHRILETRRGANTTDERLRSLETAVSHLKETLQLARERRF